MEYLATMIGEDEVEPPHENKKTDSSPPRYSSWFSSLPNDIAVKCLARLPKSHHRSLSLVSKHFSSFISSPELYAGNSHIGSLLYICLESPDHPSPRWFSLWVSFPIIRPGTRKILNYFSEIRKDPKHYHMRQTQNHLILTWNSLHLTPTRNGKLLVPTWYLSESFPVSLSTVAVGTDIYVFGGFNTPSSTVRVFDCRSHTWRNAPNMNVARRTPKTCVIDHEIYVIGGWGSDMPPVWSEVFNTKTQTWRVIPKEPKEGTWNIGYMIKRGGRNHLFRWLWVIENVMYSFTYAGIFMWYDSVGDEWRYVKGLELLFKDWKFSTGRRLMDVVNYGGRFALIIEEMPLMISGSCKTAIWYAMVTIERDEGGEVCGKIEWVRHIFYAPESYKILRCLSIPL